MVLKVSGLSKSFKNNSVLKDVSFEINRGEVTAIIGQSGAGKTTLLRCINGLEKCDKGEVLINDKYFFREVDGKSVYPPKKEIRELRKNINMVFQNFNLFPHMNVLENIIEAPINAHGINPATAKQVAREILERLGLGDKEKSYPFELSGGQKQRAAIARAHALNPDILCFDEPTSALDPGLRDEIASIIRDLAKNNTAVLVVSHDMNFVKKVADRIIFMEDGSICEDIYRSEMENRVEDGRIGRFLLQG